MYKKIGEEYLNITLKSKTISEEYFIFALKSKINYNKICKYKKIILKLKKEQENFYKNYKIYDLNLCGKDFIEYAKKSNENVFQTKKEFDEKIIFWIDQYKLFLQKNNFDKFDEQKNKFLVDFLNTY